MVNDMKREEEHPDDLFLAGMVDFSDLKDKPLTNAGEACTITTGSIDLSRFDLDEQEGVRTMNKARMIRLLEGQLFRMEARLGRSLPVCEMAPLMEQVNQTIKTLNWLRRDATELAEFSMKCGRMKVVADDLVKRVADAGPLDELGAQGIELFRFLNRLEERAEEELGGVPESIRRKWFKEAEWTDEIGGDKS